MLTEAVAGGYGGADGGGGEDELSFVEVGALERKLGAMAFGG